MTETQIKSIESRVPKMALSFACSTIQSAEDGTPPPQCCIHSAALDFMEGAYQVLQEVRIMSDLETFDYHETVKEFEEYSEIIASCNCGGDKEE